MSQILGSQLSAWCANILDQNEKKNLDFHRNLSIMQKISKIMINLIGSLLSIGIQ